MPTVRGKTKVAVPAHWPDRAAAIGVAAAAFTVFAVCAAPTVTAEDSGELIAAAWHFGIAHPPGYPLWTMLCGLFVHLLPIGSVAFWANIFSALCSATAAGVLYLAVREVGIGAPAAAAAALTVILSRWSWSQSVITEVYALNSLMTALLLWCVLRWYRSRGHKALLAASVVMGLGMCNHHVIALCGLAVVIWILIVDRRLVLRARLVIGCIGLFAVSLLPYAYLPIRAAAHPPMNWGDPSTMDRFIAHLTRQQYGAVGPTKASQPRSVGRCCRQIAYVARSVGDDLTVPVAVFAVGAVVLLGCTDRRLLVLCLLWLAGTGGLFALLANFDADRTSQWAMRVFLIPVVLGLVLPIAIAYDRIVAVLGTRAHRAAGAMIGTLLIAGAPVWMVAAHWRQCNYSNYWYAYDHARNLLACMMQNAIIFPAGDHSTFPLIYIQLVEGAREDVLIADMYGYISPRLYRDQPANSPDSPEAWLIKRARRPVYSVVKTAPPVSNARYVPAGMLYHLLPNGMPFDDSGLLERCHYRNRDSATVVDFGACHINADFEFSWGLRELERENTAAALAHFRAAVHYGWGIKELYNNIGSALAEHGLLDESTTYLTQAARLDGSYTTPRWNLQHIARQRRDWKRVAQLLREIIGAQPANTRALNALGEVLEDHLHSTNAARALWRQSLQVNPRQPQVIERLNSGGWTDQ